MAKRNTPSVRRQKPREAAYEVHKASWEKKKTTRPRAENTDLTINGKKLARDLFALFKITDMQVFKGAAEALRSLGIAEGRSKKLLKSMWEERNWSLDSFSVAVEVMTMERRRKGAKFSARETASELVDEYNLPGTSFDRAVDDLRKRFSEYERTGVLYIDCWMGKK